MSKTFTYVLLVIGVYVLIIATKYSTQKKTEETDDDETENKSGSDKILDKIEQGGTTNNTEVYQGAGGRKKYQYGQFYNGPK